MCLSSHMCVVRPYLFLRWCFVCVSVCIQARTIYCDASVVFYIGVVCVCIRSYVHIVCMYMYAYLHTINIYIHIRFWDIACHKLAWGGGGLHQHCHMACVKRCRGLEVHGSSPTCVIVGARRAVVTPYGISAARCCHPSRFGLPR